MTEVMKYVLCLSLLSLLPACSLTSDHFSCAIQVSGALVRCVDYEDVGVQYRSAAEALCRGFGGDFSTNTTCPEAGKIGGCRQEATGYTQTAWYYQGSVAMTPADVMGRCTGKETFVPVNGPPSPDAAIHRGDASPR